MKSQVQRRRGELRIDVESHEPWCRTHARIGHHANSLPLLGGLLTNQASVIHGTGNYVTALLSRFTTRELTAKLTAKLMRPRPPQLVAGARAVQP